MQADAKKNRKRYDRGIHIVSSTQMNRTMKTKKPSSSILMIFAGVVAAFLLAGCAGMGSANTTSLLTAAGFRARTPQTAKQKEIYAALPAYKVERATVNGMVFYVYKDEKAGLAYIGREPDYQRYQQLAIQQQIAQQYYAAEEMDRAAAMSWYGGFGVRRFWW
jgi:hypothetical protein